METDYDFTSARHVADLDAAEKVGRWAGERAVKRLNPRKVATRRVPVVYETRAAASLIGHLASAINGSAIARKTSFLQERLGERIFAAGVAVIDDPLRPRGLRSQPFDAEGVATVRRALIDDGVLTSWVLDCASARELGLKTTGNAHRGISSAPSPGVTNLHLSPGKATPRDLIAGISDGFYVTDLIGMGANVVTGDYSRGAAGFWIERGELTYAVSEVTIAGHLSDMFRTLVPANDLVFRQGINAPTVLVEEMTVAGV
jgi:PmbA protein